MKERKGSAEVFEVARPIQTLLFFASASYHFVVFTLHNYIIIFFLLLLSLSHLAIHLD